MKYFLTVILLLTLFNSVLCQNFSGQIVYEQTFISKDDQLTSEVLTYYMGGRHDYFIDKGSYKSVTNGLILNNQVYIDDSLTMYSYTTNSDTIYWQNVSVNSDTLLSFNIEPSDKKILNYDVKKLTMTTSKGRTTYYFSDKLSLNWRSYSNHAASFWNKAIELMKAVPLGYEIITENFEVYGTAIEVNKNINMEDAFMIPNLTEKTLLPFTY